MNDYIAIDLSRKKTQRTQRLVYDICNAGWNTLTAPAKGKLEPNHQLVEFRTPANHLKVRFSIFSVGDRGESHRRDERRIQITTTYLSSLERRGDYKDVVLGYDKENKVYVGLDPRRLEFGGQKHNASSYVEPTALESVPKGKIAVLPHETQLFGLEYQAIFSPDRISEYIFNHDLIHRGLYVGGGLFSGTVAQRKSSASPVVARDKAYGAELLVWISAVPQRTGSISSSLVAAYENGEWKKLADLSPTELESIRRKCCETGDKGEYFAFRSEKLRLQRAGKGELARKVDWVSRRTVGTGYDIGSYETDGTPRLIEVKSTTGTGMTFFMSENEWQVAKRLKSAYFVYRVVSVDADPKIRRIVNDPVSAEKDRTLERTAAGWKVQLK